jgi:NAD(P)-dependent dehydrogenase (short-subunit alcohol dehydrogenase family)
MKLKNHVAIVTGAGSGIERLVLNGCSLQYQYQVSGTLANQVSLLTRGYASC